MSTKFDPKAAAQRFISAVNSVGPEEADSSAVEAPKRGRKKETSEQKKIQTTIYFYEEELVRIEEQTGRGKKEKDKSALVRSAVDMVLDIPDLEYSSLKNAAAQQGRSMGEIVFKALQAYLGI
ncbi:hypothetical protein LIR37_14165 [Flavonifractor plautii]|jgi:hypothetical protein|uniref:hypothetical protein n=1 Tax=Flavonifractor plautii TaxID=292800 RepID=UPI000463A479|nr:hypothetical protein [Flavonifractor plautii]MCB5855507.1 hypothetical protein [Flavonifractor plautii]